MYLVLIFLFAFVYVELSKYRDGDTKWFSGSITESYKPSSDVEMIFFLTAIITGMIVRTIFFEKCFDSTLTNPGLTLFIMVGFPAMSKAFQLMIPGFPFPSVIYQFLLGSDVFALSIWCFIGTIWVVKGLASGKF